MKEIVVLSGKGGTGKTTLTAALATLANDVVVSDCDVDAADLHLVLQPEIQERHDFYSGHAAQIRVQECSDCGVCMENCRFDAISLNPESRKPEVNKAYCEGCGVCVAHCESDAIAFEQSLCGEWYLSTTRCGSMVHARLGIGAENSGKLVAMVRRKAREKATQSRASLLLVDSPPGIGCPAIASISGADYLLIVTEPSLSGKHDLLRLLELATHFKVTTFVCVNKWDINQQQTRDIESLAQERGAVIVGRMSYDTAAIRGQINQKSIIEEGNSRLSTEISLLWENLQNQINLT